MDEKDIFKTLNNIFTDEEFLLENGSNRYGFFFSTLMDHLNTVLCYYIATRDSRVLTLQEIEQNYFSIKNKVPSQEHLNNILRDGYLTHSFPGVEKKYVQEYGFDYFDKLPLDKKSRLQIIRNQLVNLEDNLKRCRFFSYRMSRNSQDIIDKELFMTFPGKKTIHYSVFAPERLYNGPINFELFEDFPIVVGESKKEYLMRVVKYQMKKCKDKKISDEEIICLANCVLDYYCNDNPCISFIKINDIKDIPIFNGIYNVGYGYSFDYKEFCNEVILRKFDLRDIFTTYMGVQPEVHDVGDLVTLSSFIDKDSISLVDFPDWYNLRQTFLKRGIKPLFLF